MFGFGEDDQQAGILGLLGKMFQQGPQGATAPAAGAPGEPMQILPQVQQDGQNPSFMDRVQSGVNKNAGDFYGMASGLLNQKPAAMPGMSPGMMKRPTLPFALGAPATPMKWGR